MTNFQSAKPRDFLATETIQNAWRNALKASDYDRVSNILETRPDMPPLAVGPYLQNPISYYLTHADLSHPESLDVLEKLTRDGTELRVPDYLRAVPADYALVGSSEKHALYMLVKTAEDAYQSRASHYIPSVVGIIATTEDPDLRAQRVQNFRHNLNYIHEALTQQAMNADIMYSEPWERAIEILQQMEHDWVLEEDDYLDLLEPSYEVSSAIDAYNSMRKAAQDPSVRIDTKLMRRALEDIRFAEWEQARNLAQPQALV